MVGWADHSRISGAIIEPLAQRGEVTARLLRFNQAQRVAERAMLQVAGLLPAPMMRRRIRPMKREGRDDEDNLSWPLRNVVGRAYV